MSALVGVPVQRAFALAFAASAAIVPIGLSAQTPMLAATADITSTTHATSFIRMAVALQATEV